MIALRGPPSLLPVGGKDRLAGETGAGGKDDLAGGAERERWKETQTEEPGWEHVLASPGAIRSHRPLPSPSRPAREGSGGGAGRGASQSPPGPRKV